MAIFTNMATLSYNGNTINSNIVSGEITEAVTISKTSLSDTYSVGETVTYIISLINSSYNDLSGLVVEDNLGAYDFHGGKLVPLDYVDGSLKYYVDGVPQRCPHVSYENFLKIEDVSIPKNGNAMIIYDAVVNEYAPLGVDDSIVNIAAVFGLCSDEVISDTHEIYVVNSPVLSILKSLNPAVVVENGVITYTFTIQNTGNTEADISDKVILEDKFNPILKQLDVSFNSQQWCENKEYTYNSNTGEFKTKEGEIFVPAAQYVQNQDGVWSIIPGVATLTVSGTI